MRNAIEQYFVAVVSVLAGAAVAIGLLITVIGVHDGLYPTEDSKVVWVCSYHGNKVCGPNAPAIDINLDNLTQW